MYERKSALYVSQRIKHPLTVAEIGNFKGGNALRLVKMNVYKLFLIDSYKEYWQYERQVTGYNQEDLNEALLECRNRMIPYTDKVTMIIQQSIKASTIFPDNYFDYVYIDGDHSYEPVLADMEAWYPKVKKGTFLAGHDYGTYDTFRAVQDFAKKYNLKVVAWCSPGEDNVKDWNKDWLIQKK